MSMTMDDSIKRWTAKRKTALVIEVIQRHAPDLDASTLVMRDSRNGNFLSVQVLITATSVEQLQAIHVDLRATGRVHMVL